MVSCSICSGGLHGRFAGVADPQTGDVFAIFECRQCLFGQTFPQPEDLLKYYSGYHGRRHGFTAEFRAWRQTKLLGQPFGNGRLLDIGCGEGTFLRAAGKQGWKGSGTEIKSERQANGSPAIFETLSEIEDEFGTATFEAATMWHSLEHFRDPVETLRAVSRLLMPEGKLLISVPDYGGLQAKFFGKDWFHIDVPRHLFHFNHTAIETMLKSWGFSIEFSRHLEFEYDLLGWSQSALNTLNRKPNIFFRTLTGQREGLGKFEMAVNFLGGTTLSALALPLLSLGSFLKRGGTLVVKARKIENSQIAKVY